MGKFDVFISLVFARSRYFNDLFFVDDAAILVFGKGVSSSFYFIKDEGTLLFILSGRRHVFFIGKVNFLTIPERSSPICDSVEFIVIKPFFASAITIKLRRLIGLLEPFSLTEGIKLFGD